MHHTTSKLPIANLNPHLACSLCGGYFIDATTIIECLHSFCKSCIVRYLETNKFCPVCDVQIHKTKPLLHIRSDQTLQAVVYKLVPGLFQREMRLRREFYEKHPEKLPEDPQARGEGTNTFIYSSDEIICLSLEYADKLIKEEEDMETDDDGVPRRYLRCPAAVTVGLLKRLVRAKYGLDPNHALDILYGDSFLCDEYSLVDLAYMFDWKRKGPMRLKYRIYQDTDMPPSPSVNEEKAESKECKDDDTKESSEVGENNLKTETTLIPEKNEPLTSSDFKKENGVEKAEKLEVVNESISVVNGSTEEPPVDNTVNIDSKASVEKEPKNQPASNGSCSEDKGETANEPIKQDADKTVYKTLKCPPKVWNPKVPAKRAASDSVSDATPAKKTLKTPRFFKVRNNEDDKGASVASVTESPVQEVAVNLTKPSSPKKTNDKKERHTPSPRTRTESSTPNPSQSKTSADESTTSKQRVAHSILPFVPEDSAQQFRFPHPAWLNMARGARPQMLLGSAPFGNRAPLPPAHFLTSLIASQQPFPYLSSLMPNDVKKGAPSSKTTGPRPLTGFPVPFNAMQGFPPGLSALLPLSREMMGTFYHSAYSQQRSFTPPPNRCASPKSSPSGANSSHTPTTSTSSSSSSKTPKAGPRLLAPRRVSAPPPPLVPISSTPGPPIRSPPTLLPLKDVDKERITPPASSSPSVTVVESSLGISEPSKEPAKEDVKETPVAEKAEEKAPTENIISNANVEKTSQDQSTGAAPSKTQAGAAADS